MMKFTFIGAAKACLWALAACGLVLAALFLYLVIGGWFLGLEVSGLDEDGPRWPLDLVGVTLIAAAVFVTGAIIFGLGALVSASRSRE
ncbi:hypothetical protein [Luethyella okanaganae]|uniref:Uncharacterized protein n=1 Tax=Luethyella okanaganae TaxID=69372 RepID=A0ABW1VE78_9MICO